MDISTLKTLYYGNGISTNFCVKKWYFYCPREKMMTSYLSPSFFPLCSRNIISSHKSLWKCHSHNKGFLMQKYPFIPLRDFSIISCKYLPFMCFVENLRTSLRKIYGHGVSLENLCINLRTNKWKIPRGNKWIFLH